MVWSERAREESRIVSRRVRFRVDSDVGGLVGYVRRSGVVIGSYFNGEVRGTQLLGGLVGSNYGEITRSYSAGKVTGSSAERNQSAGGLVGSNRSSASITSSYSVARVTGTEDVAGLVATNDGTIAFCYSTGDVIGTDLVGGLTAWNDGTITASYSTGEVSGYRAGGLSGANSEEGVIVTSYAIGRVKDNRRDGELLGGLVSRFYPGGRIIDSYWNTLTTTQRRAAGRGDPFGASGVNTPQMQRPTGYTGIYSVWRVDVDNADGDFDPSTGWDDLWDFGNSRQYPVLRVDFDGDGVASWEEFGDQREQLRRGMLRKCVVPLTCRSISEDATDRFSLVWFLS